MTRYTHGPVDKVNTIIRFFENPCAAPWVVWMQLADKPAGNVVMELLSFDFCDVLRCIFRPKGMPFSSHRKTRKTRGHIPITPLNAFERICGKVADRLGWNTRQVTDGVKALWVVDGVIQRGLWYWMVADLTLDFFYQWTTAIMRSEQCRANYSGGGLWEERNQGFFATAWQAVVNPIIRYSYGTVLVSTNGAITTRSENVTVFGSLIAKGGGITPEDQPYSMRIVKAPGIVLWDSGPRQFDKDRPNEGAVSDRITTGAGIFTMEVRGAGGPFNTWVIQESFLCVFADDVPPAPPPQPPPSVNDFFCGLPGALSS